MECIPKDRILQFNPNTLESVRKEFNLDKPGRVDEAIDILEDWVKKQTHFKKKDFSRKYLEITLISTKGSVERAKSKIDKLCTFKTLMPDYFQCTNAKELTELTKYLSSAHMPKMTNDHNRVYCFKVLYDTMDASLFFSFYQYSVIISEYLKIHDYCNGFVLIMDYTDINILNFVTKLNVVELRQALALLMDGYGMRLRGIHVISNSKMIDTLLAVFKQVLSEKLSKRIHLHKTVDTLYEHVPREILPADYGGDEKTLKELNEEWIEVFASKEHVEYMKEMCEAKTDETYRCQDKFNDSYIGMPGSFRTLSVD